ncbi:hypothetical protein [Tissierella praeacuta]
MKYIVFAKISLNKLKHYKVLSIMNICFVIIGMVLVYKYGHKKFNTIQ